ncbi:MAG: hypothetical protein D6776_07090 [Planctomycetota bacterium]|nr:MAG: hypothetical protein D6776_07090 [Planctomycetota bacterium]
MGYRNDPRYRRIMDEADRIAHEIHERVRCLREGSVPHPIHLLEELEAELETASRLGRRISTVIEEEKAAAARNSGRLPQASAG